MRIVRNVIDLVYVNTFGPDHSTRQAHLMLFSRYLYQVYKTQTVEPGQRTDVTPLGELWRAVKAMTTGKEE